MAWEPFFWLFIFVMNMTLIALILYQIVSLSDLEDDYLNPYDSSSRINKVIVPEFVLHGALSILLLLTGNWIFFMVTLFPAYFNGKRFIDRQHLIDVTEVYRFLRAEKQIRVFKLGFYLLLFIFVLIRAFAAGTFSIVLSVLHASGEGYVLEF